MPSKRLSFAPSAHWGLLQWILGKVFVLGMVLLFSSFCQHPPAYEGFIAPEYLSVASYVI